MSSSVVPPDGMKTREVFEQYIRAGFARRKAGVKTLKRARRTAADRIQFEDFSPGDDEGGPPNFRSGLLHLRRTGIEKEVSNKFEEPTKSLLQISELHLPTDRSVLRGISFEQRKRHLYTLDSLLSIILKHHDSLYRLSTGEIWVKAIDLLQLERDWRSDGASYSTAATLMGALDRLDQYTELKPIKLSTLSSWRDALKNWEKHALRVVPEVTAVTLDEIKRCVQTLSKDAQVVLMIAWLHAARIGNVFTVKVKESEIRTVDQVNQWVITWTAAKTTPKIGAYSTHSAVPKEWLKPLRDWVVGRLPDEFLVHPRLEKATVREIRFALRRLNPQHDLRSVRRGTLMAMAQKGVDVETLLVYSGHQTVPMLLRYLRQGRECQQRVQQGASAALKSLH